MGTVLNMLLFKLSPFIMANAANSTLDNVVTWGAGIGGALIAIALIISIVKDGLKYAKEGSGSVLGIVGKVAFLIICIGIVFMAANYDSIFKGGAETVANKAANAVTNEASDALGNGGGGTSE